jgi:hypothetical protein
MGLTFVIPSCSSEGLTLPTTPLAQMKKIDIATIEAARRG